MAPIVRVTAKPMTGRLRVAVVLLLIACTTRGAGQTPQVPAPTFRATVEYVEVDAVVTDAQGRAVTDLRKDDVQVFEDGAPQTISTFSLVNVPIEISTPTPFEATSEPDVRTNERPFDGRVYVMVLDDLHVDAQRSHQVQRAAHKFIETKLGTNDLMAVIFTGRDDAAQDFTGNRRLLLEAVDRFVGRQLASETLVANDAYHAQIDIASTNSKGSSAASAVPSGMRDEMAAESARHAESTLSTLRQVGQWLSGIRGRRRAVLFFSEGIGYDLSNLIDNDYVNGRERTLVAMRSTLAAMTRSNVSIYSIDPRGLSTSADDAIAVSGFADQNDPSTGIGLASLNSEMRLSQASLRQLSDESGGFAVVNQNDADAAFDRIVRDNSTYYLLAYYPAAVKPDGRLHRIEVKVNRPGLTVRTRRGYVAPEAKADPKSTNTSRGSSTLQEAMTSPVPVSGLTMRLFAAPLKGSKKNAAVVIGIELNGRELALGGSNKVDVEFAAQDQRSKVFGARHATLPLNLDGDTKTRLGNSAVRVVYRIDLPPGRYRLHAAARDQQKDLVGSVLSDLDVPDFYKTPFSMSGIMVTSRAGANMLTAVADEQLRTLLPSPVVALRTFSQDDELDLFAEVYDNTASAATITLLTTVFTRDGQPVARSEQERDANGAKGDTRAVKYREYLPLSKLPPGDYVLEVRARSPSGNNAQSTRRVPFRVVPAQAHTQP